MQRVCVGTHKGKDKHLHLGTAVLCAAILVSSMTWEWLRSVVRLQGGFCLLQVRQEEVHACVMWVLLTLLVVVISHIKRNHCLLQLDGK